MAKLYVEQDHFFEQDTSGASVISAIILIASLLILGFLFLRNGLGGDNGRTPTTQSSNTTVPVASPYTPTHMQ